MINDHIKCLLNLNTQLIHGGDFNINLLDVNSSVTVDFVNNLNAAGLHPVITLPTRATETSAILIDNFFCDVSLLPMQSTVVRTDISDHYLFEIGLKTKLSMNPSAVHNFSYTN